MANLCYHHKNPYRNQFPTAKEINEKRLCKCPDCNQWFSFLEGILIQKEV